MRTLNAEQLEKYLEFEQYDVKFNGRPLTLDEKLNLVSFVKKTVRDVLPHADNSGY